MKYPERAIATYLQSPMPDSRAQGIELAGILRGTQSEAIEGFCYYVERSGVLRWSDGKEKLQEYAHLWARGISDTYPAGVWGTPYIRAMRCVRCLEQAWRAHTQGCFFQCLLDAIAEAPDIERPKLKVYRRYCELTLGGTTNRNRALRLARALLAGDVQ